ncbi:hypothetical protein PM082_023602 [Marasmius tenuissimus]|nr:hypothetical protein PM082_023602 [Marasmius tenuissimus]
MAPSSLDGNTFGPSAEKQESRRPPIPRFDSSNSVDEVSSSTSESGTPLTDLNYRSSNTRRRRRRGGRSRKSTSHADAGREDGDVDDWEGVGHGYGQRDLAMLQQQLGHRGIPEEDEDEASSPLFEEVVEYLKEVTSMLGGLSAEDEPTTPDTGVLPPTVPSKPPASSPRKDNSAVKLRLDINLEVVLELRAKIHGDITLTLLA